MEEVDLLRDGLTSGIFGQGFKTFQAVRLTLPTVAKLRRQYSEAPYRSDITVLHRLVVDGLNYNIYRVDNVERKGQYMEITAETGVAN